MVDICCRHNISATMTHEARCFLNTEKIGLMKPEFRKCKRFPTSITWFTRYSTSLASDEATLSDMVTVRDSAMSFVRIQRWKTYYDLSNLDCIRLVNSSLRSMCLTWLEFWCVIHLQVVSQQPPSELELYLVLFGKNPTQNYLLWPSTGSWPKQSLM